MGHNNAGTTILIKLNFSLENRCSICCIEIDGDEIHYDTCS